MTLRPGLAAPRIMRGNTAMMRALRPSFPGMYLLNDDTGNIHQWTGEQWESVAGNGTPEKADILKEFQRNVLARQSFAAISASGSGSSPGIRVPGQDPSITDPTLFTAPPVPSGLPRFGGMDVPILRNGGGDGNSQTKMPSSQDTDGLQVFDTFERVRATDWGPVSPSGLFTWAQTLGGVGKSASVSDGAGIMTVGGAGSGFVLERITSASVPWNTGATGWEMQWSFRFDHLSGPVLHQSDGLEFLFDQFAQGPILDLNISSTPGFGDIQLGSGVNFGSVAKLDWVINSVYNARWEHRPGVVTRIKVWLATQAEPVNWTLSVVAVAGGSGNTMQAQWVNNGAGAIPVHKLEVFEITFAA